MSLIISFFLMFIASFIDNLRGPILPLLREELGIGDFSSGWFLFAGNSAGVVALFVLLWSINRFRDTSVLKIAVGFSILLVIAIMFLPLSLGLYYSMGAGIGASLTSLGAMSSIWVLRENKRIATDSLMCALHMLYGVASMLASALIGFLIHAQADWRWSLMPVAILLAAVWLMLSVEHKARRSVPVERQSVKLGPIHLMVLLLFAVYVACEVTTSMWMASYLHNARGIDLATASFATAGFFAVMSISRLLGFFVARPHNQGVVLVASVSLPLIFLLLGYVGYWWAFCLVGLYGPFFPVLMSRVKTAFPTQWRSMTAWIGIAIQVCLAGINLTIGEVAQVWGISRAYSLTLWSGLILVILVVLFLRMTRSRKAPSDICR